ncbi:unnamed protein product [Rhizophagus irregularis]|nr:unnamed protein product [Rhizophagus irregularis]
MQMGCKKEILILMASLTYYPKETIGDIYSSSTYNGAAPVATLQNANLIFLHKFYKFLINNYLENYSNFYYFKIKLYNV